MNKHIRIFLTGVLVVAPFGLTAYLIWWAGSRLERLGRSVLPPELDNWLLPGAGVIIALAGVYLLGLLMGWWGFRWAVGQLERLLGRLPLVKSLYESIRDILKLFAGRSNRMGRVVRYRPPGTDVQLLGIQTSAAPRGAAGSGRVAVYLPFSYMLGGLTVYAPPEALEPVDMSVEEALKIAATAEASAAQAAGPPPGEANTNLG